MSTKKPYLAIVAHPDDESLFFAGLILAQRDRPWHVICVTDGNADGQGARRHREFQTACKMLGVHQADQWSFPDIYSQRLDQTALLEQMRKLPTPAEVFTHGILGEYGHPHHQDVCHAAHQAFDGHCPVWSVAYNCYPERTILLQEDQYATKFNILTDVYGSETRRFLHLLPATAVEGFCRVDLHEVNSLYRFLTLGEALHTKDLRVYRRVWKNLQEKGPGIPERLF